MLNFAQIPAVLGRMAWDWLKALLLSAAIPAALVGALLGAGICLLSLETGLSLAATAAMILGGVEMPDLTALYLLAAIPATLAALAGLSHWGLGWYKLLRTPAGRNGLLPAFRRMAWLRQLAGRWLRAGQPDGPRRATPAAALSPAHPHRTLLGTAAALAGAASRLN